ncbi:MAG: EAL domain-containing protein [Oleiphilaceae bacterium]|nr:EAL domain-containing protein [Oleiphilaceae bacterium]
MTNNGCDTMATLKILYIEDTTSDVEVVRAMLQRAHKQGLPLELSDCPSLSEGLIHIEQQMPDLILLDLDLPDSRGVEGVRHVVRRAPQVPVVVISSTSEEEAGEAAITLGAEDYLVKGKYSYADLVRSIRYAMGRRRSQRPSDSQIDQAAQAASDVIIVIDQQGKIVFVSTSARRLFGHAQSVMTGSHINEYFSKASLPALETLMAHQQQDSETVVLTLKAGDVLQEVVCRAGYWRDKKQPFTTLFIRSQQPSPLTQKQLKQVVEAQTVVATINNLARGEETIETKLDQALMAMLSLSGLRIDGRIAGAICLIDKINAVIVRSINLDISKTMAREVLAFWQGASSLQQPPLEHEQSNSMWLRLPLTDERFEGAVVWPREVMQRNAEQCEEIKQVLPKAIAMLVDEHYQHALLNCLSLAVHQSPSGVIITDKNGVIEFANQAIYQLTGFTPEEVIGHNPRIFSAGETPKDVYKLMWKTLNEGNVWRGELLNRTRAGENYWEAITIAPIITETGIRHYVAVRENIEQRKQIETQLVELATHDSLTGLPNRTLLLDRLSQTLHRAKRASTGTALLMIDLDLFKLINEQHGHSIGDNLLKEVASRIKKAIRGSDTVGRQGGDEFIVILSDLPSEMQAKKLAYNIKSLFADPFLLLSEPILVNCSIGIAYCNDGESIPDELYRQADTALYEIKERGGNACGFYSEEMDEQISLRNWFRQAIKQAMRESEFFLVYQPKIDLASGKIIGAEALIRWLHPDRGLIGPDKFIPMAEESGHILELGRWVINEACRQIRAWLNDGLPVPRISVNLSAQQLRDESLVEYLRDCLKRFSLTPDYLDMELTESEMMQSPALAIEIMTQIQELGISISGDDFGTGYSSLSYLKRLPMDLLKIDRSFVTDITTDADSLVIASMIVSLGHDLGLKVLAEGIETEEQLALLRRLGCDEFQGYLGSPPVKADDFAALIEAGKPLVAPHVITQQQRTLLLVDDEPGVLKALHRSVRPRGFNVLTAGSGKEALTLLAKHEVGVVLSDQRMPEMTGTQLMKKVRVMYPMTTRMILSGYADIHAVLEAVNDGAVYKFLGKPWDDDVLLENIEDAFLLFESKQRKQKQESHSIRNLNA